MRRFIFSAVLMLLMVATGWYYAPQNIRDQLTAFIGIATRRDTGEIKNFLTDSVLPQDPKERREVIIQELKKNVAELKRRSDPKKEKAKAADPKVQTLTMEEIIKSSEAALDELEKSNEDKPVSQTITERIIEKILPKGSSGGGQCRQVCE